MHMSHFTVNLMVNFKSNFAHIFLKILEIDTHDSAWKTKGQTRLQPMICFYKAIKAKLTYILLTAISFETKRA